MNSLIVMISIPLILAYVIYLAGSLPFISYLTMQFYRLIKIGLLGFFFILVIVNTGVASPITRISHTIDVPEFNGITYTRTISHEIFHEKTVDTFTGANSIKQSRTFVGLGDGHVATWLEHVYRDGDDWVKQEGWYFSNGTFKPDPNFTNRYTVAKVQNIGYGLLLSWANGRYFKRNYIPRQHVQDVGIDQSLTSFAQAHPGFHPAFRVSKNLMNDAALDSQEGELVTVIESYDFLGPNPEFLLLGAVGRYAIRGIIFLDKNYDGYQDLDEGGFNGISLRLKKGNTIVTQTTTARDGSYIFMFDEPGNYVVEMDQPINTRTSYTQPTNQIDPERHAFSSSQAHNNPSKTEAWDVIAVTPIITINDDNMTERVLGGLSSLPILTWNPGVVHVVNPLPGQEEIIPFTLSMDQVWNPFLTLNFDYYPSSDRLRVNDDFTFPQSTLIGGSEYSTQRFLGMTVKHNPHLRGSESVLVDFDRVIFGTELHTASQWFVVVFHEREPDPPILGPAMTELYVGNIASDEGSPAVLFREADGNYRFAGFFRAAGSNGEAFFADVALDSNTFTMETPVGLASGVLYTDFAEGVFEQSGASLSLVKSASEGLFSEAAGLYLQEGVAGQDWDIYGVLTPEGYFFFYSEFEGEGIGGGGLQLNISGDFSITPTFGTQVRGTVANEAPFQIAAIYEEPGFSAPILLKRITKLDISNTEPPPSPSPRRKKKSALPIWLFVD
ncbi:hypothetical protein DN062_16035 [Nitrincola tibetensis]|uniref:SD-repeat containing protein B domain-containing protein n=1 Tax=Nitrincola tibetensis TaxID=2219697 RepID=A0A364NIL2_9GAMM|nr:SdrD B-like domain-containing protein [Nitrincola tibetensis]RAU16902.1 hypothetical protein DN062_16035 [Nitrincola tibetensis]